MIFSSKFVKTMLAAAIIIFSTLASSQCISFRQAPQHIGQTLCVTGKILRIDAADPGFSRLSFCRDPGKCSFTAVISDRDVKKAGGTKALQGKTVELKGLLTGLDGGAQISAPEPLPPGRRDSETPSFMKGFDAGERGHYSAGTSRAPKVKETTTTKQTATLPIDIPEDAEESGPPK